MEGETYCVRLLIGKTYDVESSQPVDVVAKSDERIVVSDVEPDSFTVVVHPARSNESQTATATLTSVKLELEAVYEARIIKISIDMYMAWQNGMKTWAIPMGWGSGGSMTMGHFRPNPTTQVFSLGGAVEDDTLFATVMTQGLQILIK